MDSVKGFVKEYNEIIYKLVMAILYIVIGGMVGYLIGVMHILKFVVV